MAMDITFWLSQLWFLFLLSAVATMLIFPIVFLTTFVYDALIEKYKKTPKILIMLVCTLLAVFVVLFLVEIYLEFTLPKIIAQVA